MKLTIIAALVSLALGAVAAEPAAESAKRKGGRPSPASAGPNPASVGPNPDIPNPNAAKGRPPEAFTGPNAGGKRPPKPAAPELGPHPEKPPPPGFKRSDKEGNPYAPDPNRPSDPAFRRSDDPRGASGAVAPAGELVPLPTDRDTEQRPLSAFSGPNPKLPPNPGVPKPKPLEAFQVPNREAPNPNPPPPGLPHEVFVGPDSPARQGKGKPARPEHAPHPEWPTPPGFKRTNGWDPNPNRAPDPAVRPR